MNRILYALVAVAVIFTSCASSYDVQGSSSVSSLDGSKLYLKAVKDNELKKIDSCDVVHGQFSFSGVLDTVRMVNLFMDDESIMPIVLEKGEIRINIDNVSQNVSGTPLNDKLYEFIDKHNQLDNRMSELSHKQSRMLLDGIDENIINEKLSLEAEKIAREEDRLVTDFIVDNFDNVLGPGVFMMITSRFKYPILTPQIEEIMTKATDKFKNNPYVKDYYQTANENEARMQGLDPSDISVPATTQESPSVLGDSASSILGGSSGLGQ
ncbi:DUF4369 domain-containing protein [Xylanibacter rodentium]|uniref:DUF4369 domain-containing protein n=1 Tax=Xylanibacter rodentium TaxID=2736289 RepID=A0ABX2ART2_9BACT|nr:DUF4369 domain-containing protein [Xylanibacter rodentium]NPE11195.1 DUF4369 domain-containing protein [Prevotella sp. PJ1A]NPE13344.1 DUF4369 domain-containing protein [Xylanibacter rodentium]NPE39112.1 DUF4369 domain-containing protein [Prevotella sp. PCJ2]